MAQDSFKSLPMKPREALEATEACLTAIYSNAYLGLKGERLALASGLLPIEFNRLKQFDPLVEIAELKGRADSEREASTHLLTAAREGDSKAALAILTYTHDWVAKQHIQVDSAQSISISVALEDAAKRVDRLTHTKSAVLEYAMQAPETSDV